MRSRTICLSPGETRAQQQERGLRRCNSSTARVYRLRYVRKQQACSGRLNMLHRFCVVLPRLFERRVVPSPTCATLCKIGCHDLFRCSRMETFWLWFIYAFSYAQSTTLTRIPPLFTVDFLIWSMLFASVTHSTRPFKSPQHRMEYGLNLKLSPSRLKILSTSRITFNGGKSRPQNGHADI